MLTAFLAGIVLGLAYGAPVGRVNLEMIRRGIAGGVGPALAVSMGSVIGDAFWLAVSGAMASAGFDVQNRTARNAYFAGIVTGAVVYGVALPGASSAS